MNILFPASISGEAGFYNPKFLAKLAKAKKLIDGDIVSMPTLYQNGLKEAALIKFDDPNFTGIVMPYRNDRPLQDGDLWWVEKPATVIPFPEREVDHD